MNLLYTITAYPPSIGGAQVHLHQLVSQLSQRHQVHVAAQWAETRTDWLLGTTLTSPRHPAPYELDGVPVDLLDLPVRERLGLVPWVLSYYLAKGTAIRRISTTLLRHLVPLAHDTNLIHNVRIGREGLSFASLQLARRLDVPFVFTPVHHPRWVGWNYRHYLDLYRQADGLIALTHSERETLIAIGARPERVFVTGIGPILAETSDAAAFRQRYSLAGPFVLFLGQKYRYKGLSTLLEAAAIVWARFPETHFLFIGPRTRYSRSLFERYHDRRILELDSVDLQAKTDALAACDLLCLPSMQESFGGVLVEAWMMGKPVIGGDVPAIRQVIDEGVDGYVVPQQPQVLAERIMYLLANPSVAETMGRQGLAKTLARYTWDRLARQTEAIYDQILN